ncbi:MAG TPA: hypothetical protein VF260_03640 [Bacilli bacterium]
MADLQYDSDLSMLRARMDNKKEKKSPGKWLPWTAAIIVWAALIAGSFGLARHYIDGIKQQLVQVEENNQANTEALTKNLDELKAQLDVHKKTTEELQKQLQAIADELTAVKEEMALAGDTLNSADDTKKALSERITDLGKELEGLRSLIKKLEEAARVY